MSVQLRLRKDIWTHYPVIVVPLGRGTDGAERHAIVWNRKKIANMRASMPTDTWSQYETTQHDQLIQALQAGAKWTVEKATNPDHICVIRMKYKMHNKPASNYEAPLVRSPILTRLTDIKAHYPVVWHAVEGANKTFALELHRKAIAARAETAGKGVDIEDQTVGLLMRALKASTAWRVIQPVLDGEFCRLEMLC